MKAVVQRVSCCGVTVDGQLVGSIGKGLLVLLGVADSDTEKELNYLAEKIVGLRIFEDSQGKMNLSLQEVEGELLVVSQFTLFGDCRKGRRPSFTGAGKPEHANALYEQFLRRAEELGVARVQHGVFGADMKVELLNDGPVTLILDTDEIMPKK